MAHQSGATPAGSAVFDMFKELGLIASSIFSEIVELHARGIGLEGGPFVLTDDELSFFCDGARWEAVQNLSKAPTFPFQIADLETALRRAEVVIAQDPWMRATQSLSGSPQFAKAYRQSLMVLQIGKRMCLNQPSLARIAFEFTPKEIEALADSTDIGLIEASANVRLIFKTNTYRDVMRAYASHGDQVVKNSRALLGHAVRWVGLARFGRLQEG
jgi:hypothetical protein